MFTEINFLGFINMHRTTDFRVFAELYPIGGFSTRQPEVILASHLIKNITFLKAHLSLGECRMLVVSKGPPSGELSYFNPTHVVVRVDQ